MNFLSLFLPSSNVSQNPIMEFPTCKCTGNTEFLAEKMFIPKDCAWTKQLKMDTNTFRVCKGCQLPKIEQITEVATAAGVVPKADEATDEWSEVEHPDDAEWQEVGETKPTLNTGSKALTVNNSNTPKGPSLSASKIRCCYRQSAE